MIGIVAFVASQQFAWLNKVELEFCTIQPLGQLKTAQVAWQVSLLRLQPGWHD
jgi:hypothetical protein